MSEQIQITSPDGPVHKFYGVVRQKHFKQRVLSAEAERDLKEAFFFGFYTAMDFLGSRLTDPELANDVACKLLADVKADVNSVIIPAKNREKSKIVLPSN